MEIRALRYFLETAREENMTRAAERLFTSQPTISKQLKELESELGVKLFIRSNHSVKLTEAGKLLRERAEDILSLVEKTEEEFKSWEDKNSGDIHIGAPESDSMSLFAEVMRKMQLDYPKIRCNIYSGNMESVCEKLDKGLLDFGVVMNYVDRSKYNYLKIPAQDAWGIALPKDDPLCAKTSFSLSDLKGLPLICSKQWLDQEFSQWFGSDTGEVNVVATYNLAFNGSIMVKAGMGYAVMLEKLIDVGEGSELTFRPISDAPKSELYVVWRKYQVFSPAADILIKELKKRFG